MHKPLKRRWLVAKERLAAAAAPPRDGSVSPLVRSASFNAPARETNAPGYHTNLLGRADEMVG